MKIFIGTFTEEDLKNGRDKQAISEAKELEQNKRNGLRFIESKIIKKSGKPHAMKVWLTDKF